MKQKYSTKGLIVKSVLLCFLVMMVMASVSLVWETYTEDVEWENDEARRISRCETYLREKEYGELWDYLELYNLQGERYEIYWDAVNDRLDEIQQEQWEKAADAGIEEAAEILQQYKE